MDRQISKFMYELIMDGWMDDYMKDRQMNGQMDGQMDGYMDGWMNTLLDGFLWIDRCMKGQFNG